MVETKGMSELGGQGGARPSPQILADQLGTIHKRHKKCPKRRRSLVDLRRQGEGGYPKNPKFGGRLLWMVPNVKCQME